MLQNSFNAILGTFYTLLNNTDLYLSYVFLGHNDSVEWGLTVTNSIICGDLFCELLMIQTSQKNSFGSSLIKDLYLISIFVRNVSIGGYLKSICQFYFWGFEADGSKVRNLALKNLIL